MANPRRAATIRPTVAAMQADQGPDLIKYEVPLDRPALFAFIVGSALADDGRTVLVPLGGGQPGAWIRQRENDQGANLTDADASLVVGGGFWRLLPAATLSASRTITLATTNAAAGDRIEITRLDVGAFTVAIVNGGVGAGTLATLPVSARSYVVAQFNGTNWLHRSSGLLL